MEKYKEKSKKQIPLRVSQALWEELTKLADDEFRSLNGQVEYLLTECVRSRKKNLKNYDQNNDN